MSSEVDPLTGAANGRAFHTTLQAAIDQGVSEDNPLTLILLDVKNFKSFNDAKGHIAGNELLADAVAGFRRALRPNDFLARIGGDEFAVLLTERRSDGHIRGLAQRIRKSVPHEQRLSIALTRATRLDTAESVLRRADTALLEASRSQD